MTYAEFKKRHRELHVKYQRARAAGEGVAEVDAEIDTLISTHGHRTYRLSKTYAVSVYVGTPAWPALTIKRYEDDRCSIHNEMDISRLTPADFRALAKVKEDIDAYVSGAADELPTSTETRE